MQTLTYTMGSDNRPLVADIQDFSIDFAEAGIKNWVQARQYESSMRQVFLNIKNEDGSPFDLTGANIWFEGLTPDDHRVIFDRQYVPIDPPAGQARIDFLAPAFAVAGSYKQSFFRIYRNGENISTLEFKFSVLADKVISGIVSSDYIQPFEEAYSDLLGIVKKADGDIKSQLAAWTTQFTDLMTQLSKQGTDTSTMLTNLQTNIASLETQIKSDGLLKQEDLDSVFGSLENSKLLGTTLVDQVNTEFEERGINAKWYGLVGDGVTNDTAAFQKLADYVNSQTKMLTIYFPDGEYLWDTTIQFNTEVLLTGATGAWLNYQGTGDAILFGKDGMTETDYLNNRVYICDGLNFKGGINSQYLLHFNKFVTQPIVRNCRFDDAGGVSKDYKAFALYFDTDNWHGWVHHNQFNVSENAGTRQFLSMATYGNSRIVIEHNVITSLDGWGVAINVDGANCQVVNNKIEGYQVNVRIGSLGIDTIVAYNYFEKNGQTVSSAVQIGDLDPKVTTYPTGIKIIGNYANLHVIADNPVSYFVGPSNTSALLKNVTMNDNWINAYSGGKQSNYIVLQNDLPGNIGNVANNNSGNSIAGILDYSGRVSTANWNGKDSAQTIETALSRKNTSRSILTDDGIYEDNVLDSKYIPILVKALAASKDYTVKLNGNTVYKAFSTGQLSFGKLSASANYDFSGALKANTIGVNKQSDSADAGQVFEGTDGNLYYMNMAGVKKQLTN